MNTRFVVRCAKTKLYIPPLQAGKSATSQSLSKTPRIFNSRAAAESAARWWAEGRHGADLDWETGYPTGFLNSYPVKGRDIKTLRVHKVTLSRSRGYPIRAIGEK